MRVADRRSAVALGAALLLTVLTVSVESVRADRPTTIPAWYDGEIVDIIPGVGANVGGVDKQAIASHAANPLYVILPVSNQDLQQVDHVLGTAIPGVAGYNPYWDIIAVTVLDGRDLTTDPFEPRRRSGTRR